MLKLWQRTITDGGDRPKLIEVPIESFSLDPEGPVVFCLPGMSTTHEEGKRINGYLKLTEHLLDGPEIHNTDLRMFSISFEDLSENKTYLAASNSDPRNYYCDEAMELVRAIFAPVISNNSQINRDEEQEKNTQSWSFSGEKKEIDEKVKSQLRKITFFSKSYGPIFGRQVAVALSDFMSAVGYTGEEIGEVCNEVCLLATGNIARTNLNQGKQFNCLYVEGTQDEKAKVLNKFRRDAPAEHKGLTIFELPDALHVLADIPYEVTAEYLDGSVKNVKDPQRHTVRLHTFRGPQSHANIDIVHRALKGMISRDETVGNLVDLLFVKPPSADEIEGANPFELSDLIDIMRVNLEINRGLLIGNVCKMRSRASVLGVLFDWDETLATSIDATLIALNKTLHIMEGKGHSYGEEAHSDWDLDKLKQEWYPTVPKFFERMFGKHGQEVVADAIEIFRKERDEIQLDHAALLPGAKALLETILEMQHVEVGILSCKDQADLEKQFRHLLPEEKFRNITVIGNQDDQPSKPDPRAFYSALEKIGVAKSNADKVILVGNSERCDIQGALNAGLEPWLLNPEGPEGFVKEIYNVTNLITLITKLQERIFGFRDALDQGIMEAGLEEKMGRLQVMRNWDELARKAGEAHEPIWKEIAREEKSEKGERGKDTNPSRSL